MIKTVWRLSFVFLLCHFRWFWGWIGFREGRRQMSRSELCFPPDIIRTKLSGKDTSESQLSVGPPFIRHWLWFPRRHPRIKPRWNEETHLFSPPTKLHLASRRRNDEGGGGGTASETPGQKAMRTNPFYPPPVEATIPTDKYRVCHQKDNNGEKHFNHHLDHHLACHQKRQ